MLAENYKTHFSFTSSIKSDKLTHLSLTLSDNEFTFVIINESQQILSAHKIEILNTISSNLSATKDWEYLIANFSLAQTSFKTIKIYRLTKNFTLIPKAFYTPNQAKVALKTSLIDIKNSSQINQNINDFYVSWILNLNEKNFLEKNFQNAQISHAGSLPINTLLYAPALANCNVLLKVNVGFIEICIKQKNTLAVYNAYSVTSTEDSLYYLLFLMQEFNLNPLTCNLAILGEISTDNELVSCIKKYIKHVNFPIASIYKQTENINIAPNHYFYTYFANT